MAIINIGEGTWLDIRTDINTMLTELYTSSGSGSPTYIIGEGNWGTIRTQINSMYQELMLATVPTTIIATAAIAGVTAPVTGATPTATIIATTEYTATISWSPSVGTFGGGTVYTATITLTPKTGYTLTGVTANFFTVAGATTTNPINSGVVSSVFPTTTAGPDTLSTGLISYWKMDDASTPVVDSMGINNGVATGCTFSQTSKNGTLGTSILFNGTSDVIVPPNDSTFPANNFSCSAWVKASTTSYGHGGIFSTSYGAVTLSYNYNAYLDTRFAFCVNQVTAQAATSNWDTNWHFLVGTYDRTLGSNNIKLYVDGTLNAQANDIVGFANSYINMGKATGNGEFFPGYIDEVGTWGKVLTQAEITELYNSGTGVSYPFITVYTDNFDAYSIGALGGQGNWVAALGTMSVVDVSGDKCVYPSDGSYTNVLYNKTFSDNQYSEATVQILGSTTWIGVAVRMSGSAGTSNGYMWVGEQNTSTIRKITNGSVSTIVFGAGFVNGDIIRLEVNGTTFKAYRNGVLDTSIDTDGIFTDATFSTGKPGIGGYGSDSSGNKLRTWNGGDL